MTAATVLMILNIIGSLFGVVAEAPSVIDEIKSLLDKVRPYANECGVDVATEFVAAEERLQALGAK